LSLLLNGNNRKDIWKYLKIELEVIGINLEKILDKEEFRENFELLISKSQGHIERKDMPSISFKERDSLKLFIEGYNAKDSNKKKKLKKKSKDIKVEIVKEKVKDLNPLQDDLYIEKIVKNIVKYGIPTKENFITKRTLIVARDNIILDGHHRWMTAMIFNPELQLEILKVDLEYDKLYSLLMEYEKLA